jgi:hypothetical protein
MRSGILSALILVHLYVGSFAALFPVCRQADEVRKSSAPKKYYPISLRYPNQLQRRRVLASKPPAFDRDTAHGRDVRHAASLEQPVRFRFGMFLVYMLMRLQI